MPTNHVQDRTLLAGLTRFKTFAQRAITWLSGGVATGDPGSVTEVDFSTGLAATQNGSRLTVVASGGSGTVTSVGITTGSSGVGVSNSPITTSGDIDLDLGTAADRDVPAAGDAGPTEVVLGNDSRLGGGGSSRVIGFGINGGGIALTAGQTSRAVRVKGTGTISLSTIFLDPGSATADCVVDILTSNLANYDTGTSIVASANPTLTSAIKDEDSTLTGWTTTIVDGNFYWMEIVSVTGVTSVTVNLGIDP